MVTYTNIILCIIFILVLIFYSLSTITLKSDTPSQSRGHTTSLQNRSVLLKQMEYQQPVRVVDPLLVKASGGHFRTSDLDSNINNIARKLEISNNSVVRTALETKVTQLKQSVKELRGSKKVLMPIDPEAVNLTTELQNVTRCLLFLKYGIGPHLVRMVLKFPKSMQEEKFLKELSPDNVTLSIAVIIELAPENWLPHAVFTFLEIVRTFRKGNFHRNAAHVLQVLCSP